MHLADNINIPGGLLGGLIVGSSTSLFMLLSGQITGISGIAEGTFLPNGQDWNWSYILGLLASGAVLAQANPGAFEVVYPLSSTTLVVAGLLTGAGTRMSGGCTSGHGLCGLGRRSPRSLAAVLTFMASGAVTAFISRSPKVLPYLTTSVNPFFSADMDNALMVIVPSAIVLAGAVLLNRYRVHLAKCAADPKAEECYVPPTPSSSSSLAMHAASFLSSFMFGMGLGVSGMCSAERVLRFLDFAGPSGWDPTLMGVMGGGVAVTFSAFHYFKNNNVLTTLNSNVDLGKKLNMGLVQANLKVDWRLICGSALFGMGWGLGGMCPGPAIVSLGAALPAAGKFIPGLIMGMLMKDLVMP